VDVDQRRWLEGIAAACEHILASDDAEPVAREDPELMEDVRELLAATNARLS